MLQRFKKALIIISSVLSCPCSAAIQCNYLFCYLFALGFKPLCWNNLISASVWYLLLRMKPTIDSDGISWNISDRLLWTVTPSADTALEEGGIDHRAFHVLLKDDIYVRVLISCILFIQPCFAYYMLIICISVPKRVTVVNLLRHCIGKHVLDIINMLMSSTLSIFSTKLPLICLFRYWYCDSCSVVGI